MGMRRTSSVGEPPPDPAGVAAAELVRDVLWNASVDLHYDPADMADIGPPEPPDPRVLTASAPVPAGWCTTMTVHLDERVAGLLSPGGGTPPRPLAALPDAALRTCATFGAVTVDPVSGALPPPVRRALRDSVIVELLRRQRDGSGGAEPPELLAEILE